MSSELTTTEKPKKPRSSKKSCVVCANLIPSSAKKCTHCGSYQGLISRYINFNVPVLSLLVAIIAIISSSSEKLYEYFYPKSPAMVTIKSFEGNELLLEVANESSDLISLQQLSCHLNIDEKLNKRVYAIFSYTYNNFVPPSSIKEVIYQYFGGSIIDIPYNIDTDSQYFDLRFSQVGGCNSDYTKCSAGGGHPIPTCILTYKTPRTERNWTSFGFMGLTERLEEMAKQIGDLENSEGKR